MTSVNGDSKRPPVKHDEHSKETHLHSDVGHSVHADKMPSLEDETTTFGRSRKPTVKGLAHKLATLQRLVSRLYRRLEKQIGIVYKLLTADNIDLVNSETTHLDRIYTELSDTYARAGVAVADDDLGENSEEYLALIIRIDEADSK